MRTVRGTIFYKSFIGVEGGPLLRCDNLEGWLNDGDSGFFTIKEVGNNVYHVINFFKHS
jgi:hypothetical protein